MKALGAYVVTLLVSKVLSKFHAGRFKPGKFEYPDLNGWMLLDQAVEKCEGDLACGGFTFKGSFHTKDELMEIYFFHIIQTKKDKLTIFKDFLLRFSYLELHFPCLADIPITESKQNPTYLYWSFYVVDRYYVRIPNKKVKINARKSVQSKNR